MGFFQNILNQLRENEKEIMIEKSGSTRAGGREKDRAGQSYLYKLNGMESEVLEVRFNENVRGAELNRALTESMKRYPYFNTRLIEKNGDFYIVQNDAAPVARKTRTLARLGGIECGYHLVDITYYGTSIYISFHHALCDGRGIKPFAETLIWYYCKFRYGNDTPVDGVRLAGEKLLDGETDDPFAGPAYEYDETKEFESPSRDAFALPEADETDGKDYRYEAVIDGGQFMAVCKRVNATPAILVALMASGAIAELYPDRDKPINANIAADMREALDCPDTFKNCVRSMILPYDEKIAAMTVKERAETYRKLLGEQRDRDYCRREANAIIGLFDKLDACPSYEEKRKIMSFFEKMRLNTYVISYLGKFILGENSKRINSIHLYNSGTDGLGINMIACGDKFILDFKQSFESDKYVAAFIAQADSLGLACHTGKAIEFATPADKLIKRGR
ncbi:MAG TPA: hypothetical protein H9693_01315 [Firmicutes bacterium]|nr:hypothetical protein [Bacillota bacterium]